MTDQDHGGRAADEGAMAELDAAWAELERGLAAYLVTMTGEGDHLLVELGSGCGDDGCLPYAQFASYAGGGLLRAEISGDSYLRPQHRLGSAAAEHLARLGWAGNDDEGGEARNWCLERPAGDADALAAVAAQVVHALRHGFGVLHPQLLTREAWGPAAVGVDVLGLCASEDVPEDVVDAVRTPCSAVALEPADRDELVGLVGALLREKYDEDPTVDDDGDYLLEHMRQPVWVRVRTDQSAVEIMARVVHDVRSRRATAVELSLLNRDNLWSRWILRDRAVWQTLLLPGFPFVPVHLATMLDVFFEAMESTRDDLALRTGAKVA